MALNTTRSQDGGGLLGDGESARHRTDPLVVALPSDIGACGFLTDGTAVTY